MNKVDIWILKEILEALRKGKELNYKARINKDICESTRLSVDSDNMFDKAIEGIKALLMDNEE